MTNMLHIGILAHSAEGATLCYRTAWLEGIARLGPHNHPEITLTGIAMHHALDAWERGDLQTLRAIFMADAAKLAAAGADFFVLPDNSAHIALEAPGQPFPIPCLHIAEVVARPAAERGHRQDRHPGHRMDDGRPGLSRRFRPPRSRMGRAGRRGPGDRPQT